MSERTRAIFAIAMILSVFLWFGSVGLRVVGLLPQAQANTPAPTIQLASLESLERTARVAAEAEWAYAITLECDKQSVKFAATPDAISRLYAECSRKYYGL